MYKCTVYAHTLCMNTMNCNKRKLSVTQQFTSKSCGEPIDACDNNPATKRRPVNSNGPSFLKRHRPYVIVLRPNGKQWKTVYPWIIVREGGTKWNVKMEMEANDISAGTDTSGAPKLQNGLLVLRWFTWTLKKIKLRWSLISNFFLTFYTFALAHGRKNRYFEEESKNNVLLSRG